MLLVLIQRDRTNLSEKIKGMNEKLVKGSWVGLRQGIQVWIFLYQRNVE